MPNKSTFGMKLTPRPISPQIAGRITQAVFYNTDYEARFRNVRDIVKREVFDFNTRYTETPTTQEDEWIDAVTNMCIVSNYAGFGTPKGFIDLYI